MACTANNGAEAMRLFHRSGELSGSVLVRRVQYAVNHAVGAGLVNLGEVGAFLVLLAHDLDNLLGRVGVVSIREHVLSRVVAISILVSAENIDSVAADAQARPGNKPLVDGVAHCRIGGSCAFCTHIALGSEAGHHIVFGSLFSEDRAPWHRLDYRLEVFGAGVQKQMNVRINHARHQGGVAQIDDLALRPDALRWFLPRECDCLRREFRPAAASHRYQPGAGAQRAAQSAPGLRLAAVQRLIG